MKTNNGKQGGLLDGKKHTEGGIKAVVTDSNTPVELESGEVIINAEAVKKHWKKLDEINQSEGDGVPISKPVGGVAALGGAIKSEGMAFGGPIPQRTYLGEVGGSKHSSALAQAKLLHEKGEETRIATGWFRNPHDEKWRFEISDKDFKFIADFDKIKAYLKLNETKEIESPLEDIVEHNGLFKAYQNFIGFKVIFTYNKKNISPSSVITEENKHAYLIYNFYGEENFFRTKNSTQEGALRKGIFIHEIQHIIQIREGMGGGSTQKWQFERILKEQGLDEGRISEIRRDILWSDAHKRTVNSSGEIESMDTERRLELTDSERKNIIPLSSVNIDGKYLNIHLENPETFNTGGSITNTELDKAVSDLHRAETNQKLMKDANVIIRKNKDVHKKLMELGLSEDQAQKIQTPDFARRVGFPTYSLTNNNANIKRLQDRVNMLTKKLEGAEKASEGQEEKYEFTEEGGGTIDINYAEDRVQIKFPSSGGRVSKELFNKLRHNGYVFSRTNEAFQRKITPQAISNAIHLFSATKVGGNQPETSNKEPKELDYEKMLSTRNFTYVSGNIYNAIAREYKGDNTFHLVFFDLVRENVVSSIKEYFKKHLPEIDADKLTVNVYPKTYVREANELFSKGAYLPSTNPPKAVLGSLYQNAKNFFALQKDSERFEPEATTVAEEKTNELRFPNLEDRHPLNILDTSSSQYKEALKEYQSSWRGKSDALVDKFNSSNSSKVPASNDKPPVEKMKYDWDQQYEDGKWLSERELEFLDIYDDNVASGTFFDGGTDQGLRVKDVVNLLKIATKPVKIAIIIDKSMANNAKKFARLQNMAKNADMIIADNNEESRSERRMYPFLFIPKELSANYKISDTFKEPIKESKFYRTQEMVRYAIEDGSFQKQIKNGVRTKQQVIDYIKEYELPVPEFLLQDVTSAPEINTIADQLKQAFAKATIEQYLVDMPTTVKKLWSYLKKREGDSSTGMEVKYDNKYVTDFFHYAYRALKGPQYGDNTMDFKALFIKNYGQKSFDAIADMLDQYRMTLKNGAFLGINTDKFSGAITRIVFFFPQVFSGIETNAKFYAEAKAKPETERNSGEVMIINDVEKLLSSKSETFTDKEIYLMSFPEFLSNIKLRDNSFGADKKVEIVRYFPDQHTEVIGSISNTNSEDKENPYVRLQLEKYHWNQCFNAVNRGEKIPKENIDFYKSTESVLNEETGSAGYNIEKNIKASETMPENNNKVVRDKYYIMRTGGFQEVEKIEEIEFGGFNFFVFKDSFKQYGLAEDRTGLFVGSAKDDKAEAITIAMELLDKNKEQLPSALEKGKTSPRYDLESLPFEEVQYNKMKQYIEDKDFLNVLKLISNKDNKVSRKIYSQLSGYPVKSNTTAKELESSLYSIYGFDIESERKAEATKKEEVRKESDKAHWESVASKYPFLNLEGITPLELGRIQTYLDKKWRFDEGVMTMGEYLNLHKEKYVVKEEKLNKWTAKGELRATPVMEYRLLDTSGYIRDIPKIVYDRFIVSTVGKVELLEKVKQYREIAIDKELQAGESVLTSYESTRKVFREKYNSSQPSEWEFTDEEAMAGDVFTQTSLNNRAFAIHQAMIEGLPIPEKVLAEYGRLKESKYVGSNVNATKEEAKTELEKYKLSWNDNERDAWDAVLSKGKGLMIKSKKKAEIEYKNLLAQELIVIWDDVIKPTRKADDLMIKQPEKTSTSFREVNEGDYVEVHGYTKEAGKIVKIDEGKVTFKYGNHYLKLDDDSERKYTYSNTYYVIPEAIVAPAKSEDEDDVTKLTDEKLVSYLGMLKIKGAGNVFGHEKRQQLVNDIEAEIKKRKNKNIVNLLPTLQTRFEKAIKDFGITEIFVDESGELHVTSSHDVPADYIDAFEKEIEKNKNAPSVVFATGDTVSLSIDPKGVKGKIVNIISVGGTVKDIMIKWEGEEQVDFAKPTDIVLVEPSSATKVEGEVFYTTSSENSDGFGTKTVEFTEWLDSRNKPVRKVFIPLKAHEWQIARYHSGNDGAFNQSDFDKFKTTLFHKFNEPKIVEPVTEQKTIKTYAIKSPFFGMEVLKEGLTPDEAIDKVRVKVSEMNHTTSLPAKNKFTYRLVSEAELEERNKPEEEDEPKNTEPVGEVLHTSASKSDDGYMTLAEIQKLSEDLKKRFPFVGKVAENNVLSPTVFKLVGEVFPKLNLNLYFADHTSTDYFSKQELEILDEYAWENNLKGYTNLKPSEGSSSFASILFVKNGDFQLNYNKSYKFVPVDATNEKIVKLEEVLPTIKENLPYTVVGSGIVKWKDKDSAQAYMKGTVLEIGYFTSFMSDKYTTVTLGESLPSGWYSATQRIGKGNKLPLEPLTETSLLSYRFTTESDLEDNEPEVGIASETITMPTQSEEDLNDIDPTWDAKKGIKMKKFFFDNYGSIKEKFNIEKFSNDTNLKLSVSFGVNGGTGDLDLSRNAQPENYSPNAYESITALSKYIKDNYDSFVEASYSAGETKEGLIEFAGRFPFEKFLQSFKQGSFGAFPIDIKKANDLAGLKKEQLLEEKIKLVKKLWLELRPLYKANKKAEDMEQAKFTEQFAKERADFHTQNIINMAYEQSDKMDQQIQDMDDQEILSRYPKLTKQQVKDTFTKVETILAQSSTTTTPADKYILEQYEGFGSQTHLNLSKEEQKGLLHQFYTPYIFVKKMMDIAVKYGYPQGGTILEPSMGTGRFFKYAPEGSNCIGFDPDKKNIEIAKRLYPTATIYNEAFETAFLEKPRLNKMLKKSWLPEADLVIGNPPYGAYEGYYKSYMPSIFKRFEFLFIYLGLKLLKKDGLLIFIISQNFMNNGAMYNGMKAKILEIGEFVDAVRLPNGIFSTTEVGTDIIVFRRK